MIVLLGVVAPTTSRSLFDGSVGSCDTAVRMLNQLSSESCPLVVLALITLFSDTTQRGLEGVAQRGERRISPRVILARLHLQHRSPTDPHLPQTARQLPSALRALGRSHVVDQLAHSSAQRQSREHHIGVGSRRPAPPGAGKRKPLIPVSLAELDLRFPRPPEASPADGPPTSSARCPSCSRCHQSRSRATHSGGVDNLHPAAHFSAPHTGGSPRRRARTSTSSRAPPRHRAHRRKTTSPHRETHTGPVPNREGTSGFARSKGDGAGQSHLERSPDRRTLAHRTRRCNRAPRPAPRTNTLGACRQGAPLPRSSRIRTLNS